MDRVKSVNRVFLATVLVSLLGAVFNNWVGMFTDNYLVLLLISQIILVIPSVVYLLIYKLNVGRAIRFHKIKLSNVILIIVFAYLISPLMSFINALSMMFVQNDISDVMFNIVEHNSLLTSFLMVAFIPCILEESVYRGILYNEYSKINPRKAIFLSGFLFGIIHGNLNQFSYAFVMGIVFALLIEATDSILATMIVHFIINGTSVLTMGLYPKLVKILESVYGSDQFNAQALIDQMTSEIGQNLDPSFLLFYGLGALIPTILAYIVFRTIAKNSGRWNYILQIFGKGNREDVTNIKVSSDNLDESNQNPILRKRQQLLSLSLVIGIIICIVLLIVNEFIPSDVPDQAKEGFSTIVNLIQL
jgi:membrane protease YdiL (CAAX protease family)